MTHDEWEDYAADLFLLIAKTRGIVYELEDAMGAIQYLIQPRRKVDVSRIRWRKRRVVDRATPLH